MADQLANPLSSAFAQPQRRVAASQSLSRQVRQASGSRVRVSAGRSQRFSGSLDRQDRFDPNLDGAYADDFVLRRLKPGQRVEVTVNAQRMDPVVQLINARTGDIVLEGENISPLSRNARMTFAVQPRGRYLVRVSSNFPRETGNYGVKFRFFDAQPTNSFNFFYGSGLVDASAAVAAAIGQPTFPEVGDRGEDFLGADLIRATEVWEQGFTGQGVTIAILDDGVDYLHPDLRDNIWTNTREVADNGLDDDGNGYIDDIVGWNFVDNTNNPTDLSFDGHGTHVAGVAAANGSTIKGIAYNAKIMAIKVIGNQGAFDRDIAQGVQYAVRNGAKVINMSLGGETEALAPELEEALNFAAQSGVTVVIASGNERQSGGTLRPSNPALFAAARDLGIAVGAVDYSRQLFLDGNPAGRQDLNYVVAPGVEVRSTTPNASYRFLSGTSMATPHVAGVAALMLSANPTLTPSQIYAVLEATARKEVRQVA